MSMMPELELLEMHGVVSPLLVPFHGTLHGKLTRQTEDNFRKAAVVHCTGQDGYLLWHDSFQSIKIWTGSVTLSVLSQISTLAPKIEVLDIHVRNKAQDDWGQVCTLTSAMRSLEFRYIVLTSLIPQPAQHAVHHMSQKSGSPLCPSKLCSEQTMEIRTALLQ